MQKHPLIAVPHAAAGSQLPSAELPAGLLLWVLARASLSYLECVLMTWIGAHGPCWGCFLGFTAPREDKRVPEGRRVATLLLKRVLWGK